MLAYGAQEIAASVLLYPLEIAAALASGRVPTLKRN
jgi:hypothetical protein